jgi:uncharacterized protein
MQTRICLQSGRTVKNALRFCNDSVNRQRNPEISSAAVHFQDLTDVEQRVLGCLIEKRWTTPDQYPLSINALRLACNQSTNRDPVTRYTEDQIFQAGQRLSKYGLARLASGHSSRATKYRHLAEEGLGLNRDQLALLCVLLLRGPQTPGELKQRSERLVESELSLADVERVLAELTARDYATDLGRRPGQKEDRWAQLLGGPVAGFSEVGLTASRDFERPPSENRAEGPLSDGHRPSAPSVPATVSAPVAAPPVDDAAVRELRERVAALEADLAWLREQLSDLLS